jgi:hypothetical protein
MIVVKQCALGTGIEIRAVEQNRHFAKLFNK